MSRQDSLRVIPLLAVSSTLLLPSLATAQNPPAPAFDYGDQDDRKELEEVKGVEWSAQAQAGFVGTTGNTRTTSVTMAGSAARKEGNNKFQFDASLSFAKSSLRTATDADASGTLGPGEISRQSITTNETWNVKGRYDRFLTEHNSLYVAGLAGGDKPAGKEFVGGAQGGYSRQLYKSDKHEVVGEGGYDFTYENLVGGDSLSIHSARLFSGYKGTVREGTAIEGSLEFLANFNPLETAAGRIKAFRDRRTTLQAALTTQLLEKISFRFAFTAKHDSAPAPLPPLALPYDAGYVPVADKLDTKTEAVLVVTFM